MPLRFIWLAQYLAGSPLFTKTYFVGQDMGARCYECHFQGPLIITKLHRVMVMMVYTGVVCYFCVSVYNYLRVAYYPRKDFL